MIIWFENPGMAFSENGVPHIVDKSDRYFKWCHSVELEDIDGDGNDDMILLFNTQGLGLTEDDVEATLSGETIEGAYFTGTDSVKIIKSKNR